MIQFAYLVILLFLFGNIFFYYKYHKLKVAIKSYDNIGTGRYGFYKYIGNYSQYNGYVYVLEIDRYTDGYSKIKIDKIEAFTNSNQNDVTTRVNNNFVSLKLTSEIEWLESEDHIRKLRKEKLESLKKM